MDLYGEKLKVWKECADYRALLTAADSSASPESNTRITATGVDDERVIKMPGSFDW